MGDLVEALELLYYSQNRLLFSDEYRKLMDSKCKTFMEAHGVTISSQQQLRGRPKLPNRQTDNPPDVQPLSP